MYWSYHQDNEYYNDSISKIAYVFTSLMLIFTLFLSAFYSYTVMTQSKSLGNYKWFLLYNAFWCVLFEITLTITKPVLLSPAPAGYILGPLGSVCTLKVTIVFAILDIEFAVMSASGLLASLFYRYVSIIPGLMHKIVHSTYTIIFLVFYHIAPLAFGTYYCVRYLNLDRNVFIHEALKYDKKFEEFIDEPSFIFFYPDVVKTILSAIILLIFVAATVLITVSLLLMYKVKSSSLAKANTAITFTLFIQVSATVLFQLIPVLIIFVTWALQVPNTFTVSMICISVLTMQASVEMILILYSVSPYRKFIIGLKNKILGRKTKEKDQIANISRHIMIPFIGWRRKATHRIRNNSLFP